MITIYVWDFLGKQVAWGHASMHCRDRYISWWPEPKGRTPWTSKVPDVYDAHPYVVRTFEDDVADEDDRLPDWKIPVGGLDERKIKIWWEAFNPQAHGVHGPPSHPWSSLTWNCATIVATALTIGGGADLAPWYYSRSIVWTPNYVRQYALAIAAAASSRAH